MKSHQQLPALKTLLLTMMQENVYYSFGYWTSITSDNDAVASIVNDALANYPVGTTTVTWTVTDASGNRQVANN